MQYEQIKYVPQGQDPSLTIETERLAAKVIDNTGLLLAENVECKSFNGRYGNHSAVPFSHHLGYHGIRCLYDKQEKRNVVVPFGSWLNLQGVSLEGCENDPVDERASYGVARGWPIRMERKGRGAALTLDPMPSTRFAYTVEFQPAEPDAVDFSVRFTFARRPDAGAVRFRASWPCYINAYDDVRFFYPEGAPDDWRWAGLGRKPDLVIGEPVAYEHQQDVFPAEAQVLPVGYGRIGERALVLMFDDPAVKFFVVNAGGHAPYSPVQNPAWDFEWAVQDYPLNQPAGFDGRLVYATFEGPEWVLDKYRQWCDSSRPGHARS